jgi:hypothetical protein
VISSFLARTGLAARAALALAALVVAACGSGAVSAPPTTTTPGPISVSPSSATVYSSLPTEFLVTGGTGTYFITSSDQAVIPAVGLFEGNVFTVVPGQVVADTNVTLTVRDTGATAPVTASLVVKPRTVSNIVTVTPSASQSAACGTSICAGGDAEVKATLSLGGVPLRNHEVRFQVVSGDFRIITSAAGSSEATGLTGTAITDDTGTARIRIRALPDAAAQTGLIQITDVTSGAFTRAGINIAPSSNAPLNAQPNRITFEGRDASTCASGIQADVIVFGGRPPYQISQPGNFAINTPQVSTSGGRFTVTAIGNCTAGSTIAVVDSNGATVPVLVVSTVSTSIVPPAPLVVSPTSVTLDTCTTEANVAVAGGLGRNSYFVASGSNYVIAQVVGFTGNAATVNIRRAPVGTPGATLSSPVTVGISDGQTVREVTVNLVGPAAGSC